MSNKPDFADRRLEFASGFAVLATVSSVAFTFLCLLIVRIANSALLADGSLSLSVAQGKSYNHDLVSYGVMIFAFLVVSLLPALALRTRGFLRAVRIAVPVLALLVVAYGLLQVLPAYSTGGSPNYLQHFYTLIGGWSLAGSWLIFLARIRSL